MHDAEAVAVAEGAQHLRQREPRLRLARPLVGLLAHKIDERGPGLDSHQLHHDCQMAGAQSHTHEADNVGVGEGVQGDELSLEVRAVSAVLQSQVLHSNVDTCHHVRLPVHLSKRPFPENAHPPITVERGRLHRAARRDFREAASTHLFFRTSNLPARYAPRGLIVRLVWSGLCLCEW